MFRFVPFMEGGNVRDVTDDNRVNKADEVSFLHALLPVGHSFQ